MYAAEKLPVPPYDTHIENFKGKPQWQRIKAWDSKWKKQVSSDSITPKKWPISGDKFKRLLELLSAVNQSLGRVLATLEEMGELENTVIVYSSDNGYFKGDHGYWDKIIAYNNSMIIPMLIRYPTMIKAKILIKENALNIDLAPTIFELAGIRKPAYMQGESLVKLFT